MRMRMAKENSRLRKKGRSHNCGISTVPRGIPPLSISLNQALSKHPVLFWWLPTTTVYLGLLTPGAGNHHSLI